MLFSKALGKVVGVHWAFKRELLLDRILLLFRNTAGLLWGHRCLWLAWTTTGQAFVPYPVPKTEISFRRECLLVTKT